MYLALTGLLLCLAVLFFQDWRHRKIHIGLPVAVFLISFFLVYETPELIRIIALNAAFFLIILSLLVVYMSIKNKQFSNPFRHYFGLGDLLFYLAVTPLFVLRNYVLFFILSMLFAIVLQLAFRKRMQHPTVPLAGFSALFLILVILNDQLADFQKMTLL